MCLRRFSILSRFMRLSPLYQFRPYYSNNKPPEKDCDTFRKELANAVKKRRQAAQKQAMDKVKENVKKCVEERTDALCESIAGMDNKEKKSTMSILECLVDAIKKTCLDKELKKLCEKHEMEKKCRVIAQQKETEDLIKSCKKGVKSDDKDDKNSKKKSKSKDKKSNGKKDKKCEKNEKEALKEKCKKKESLEDKCKELNKKKKGKKSDPIQKICQDLAKKKNKCEKPDEKDEKQPSVYSQKMDKCINTQWKSICDIRGKLSEDKKAELALLHKCLSAKVKERCRKKVLKEMCKAAGGGTKRPKKKGPKKDKKKGLEEKCEELAKKEKKERAEKDLKKKCANDALKEKCKKLADKNKKKTNSAKKDKKKGDSCNKKSNSDKKGLSTTSDQKNNPSANKSKDEKQKNRENELMKKAEAEALKKICKEMSKVKNEKFKDKAKKISLAEESEELAKKEAGKALMKKYDMAAIKEKCQNLDDKNDKGKKKDKSAKKDKIKGHSSNEKAKGDKKLADKKDTNIKKGKKKDDSSNKKTMGDKKGPSAKANKKENPSAKKNNNEKQDAEIAALIEKCKKIDEKDKLKNKGDKVQFPNESTKKGNTSMVQSKNLVVKTNKLDEKCKKNDSIRKGDEDAAKNIMNFRRCIYKSLHEQEVQDGKKVTIVGTGAVGMACAIALLSKNITNHISLYDVNSKWCEAERLDLLHGSVFLFNAQIDKCTDLESTKDSRVVVVTAGARVKHNESRLSNVLKTADIIKSLLPPLAEKSPKATFLIVTNPADVMTWLAQKVTGLPLERCFSTGCHLDSSRFRMLIAHILGVATRSVHGYVIGEHGDSSVPLWSTVTVGGVRLQSILPNIGTDTDPMNWSKVHKDVIEAAFKVIKVKGYTNWAIGLTVADIVSAIFENSNRIICVSTNAEGICGIKDNIFLSLPCMIKNYGISGIIRPQLTEWEKKRLAKSAEILLKAQCSIKL